MNLQKLNDWLQLGAALGVIAGLGLVAYELRQQHQLVRAELASDTFSAFQDVGRSLQSEPVAAAYAKSIMAPDTLTPEEQVIVEGLYLEMMNVFLIRQEYFVSRGFFEIDRDQIGIQGAGFIFAGDHGRNWWSENRRKFPPFVGEIMDGHAERGDGLPTTSTLIKLREGMPR